MKSLTEDIADVVAIDYLLAGIDMRKLFLEFNVEEYFRDSLLSKVGRFYLLFMSSEVCINDFDVIVIYKL